MHVQDFALIPNYPQLYCNHSSVPSTLSFALTNDASTYYPHHILLFNLQPQQDQENPGWHLPLSTVAMKYEILDIYSHANTIYSPWYPPYKLYEMDQNIGVATTLILEGADFV